MRFLIHMYLLILASSTFISALTSAELNQQGVTAFKKGEIQQAYTYFSQALIQSPENSSIQTNLIAACQKYAALLQKEGKNDHAVTLLKETQILVPDDTTLRNNLLNIFINNGNIALNNRDYTTAKKAVYEMQQLYKGHPATLTLSGNLAYALHDLEKALTYWNKALSLNPSDLHLARRIEAVSKEAGSQQSYSRSEAYTFDIRFDSEAVGSKVYDIKSFLMDAYSSVGQDLNSYPSYPIAVILSRENEFRLNNNVPEYVAGLYDGKIRLPINFVRYPLATVKGILFHEYTHAVIYEIAGSNCPIWINEGIAMREMSTQIRIETSALVSALNSSTTLSIDQMSNQSTWHSSEKLSLAYSQAWIMTEYLFYRWSNTQIISLLQQLKNGATFESVLRSSMNRTVQQFEKEWLTYAKNRKL